MVDWFDGIDRVFAYPKDKPQETLKALQKLGDDFEMQRHHHIIEKLEEKVSALEGVVVFFAATGLYVCLEAKDKVLTAAYMIAVAWLAYYLYVKDREIETIKSAEFTCKRVECPK